MLKARSHETDKAMVYRVSAASWLELYRLWRLAELT